jgi:hypothetical protein
MLLAGSSHATETEKCRNSFQIGQTRGLEIIASIKGS